MNARRKQSSVRSRPSEQVAPGWSWRGIVVSALILSRWFLPAEAADRGITLWLTALTFLAIGCADWFAWRSGWRLRKWQALDWAVAAFVGGHLASAGAVIWLGGDRRGAVNIAWEWVALWAIYRALISKWGETGRIRPPASQLLLVWVVLAAYGIWQHHVWFPGMAEAVRSQLGSDLADTKDWQRHLGRQLRTLDSTGRQLLLARLTESTEPIGRFALANTLAGGLAVASLLSAGIAVARWRLSRFARIWWVLATGVLGYCLVLTKSRTAYVGLAVGILFWAASEMLTSAPRQRRAFLWGLCGCAGVTAAALGVLFATGSLDRQVLTEAPKSLEYRLQYWSATWKMIVDHPILGVGPGNFRQHYLRYKLPESSEEILDPHNEFLDAWANGGLIALAGLIAVWILVIRATWQLLRRETDRPASNDLPLDPSTSPRIPATSTAFATAVCVLAGEWFINGLFDSQLFWLLAGWIGVSAVYDWILGQRSAGTNSMVPRPVFAAAWLALAVHLLGAGGLGMTAVMQLWLWLAVCITWCNRKSVAASSLKPANGDRVTPDTGRRLAVLVPVAWLTAAVLCTVTAVVPNSLSESAVEMGRSALAGLMPIQQAKSAVQAAIDADPFAPEPRQIMSQLLMVQWQRRTTAADPLFEEAVRWQREAVALDPAGPNRYRLMGDLYWERYQRTLNDVDASAAADWYGRAAEKYPNLPAIQAEHALAADAAGRQAQEIARRALQLHELNRRLGHVDKLLSDERLKQLERIANLPDEAAAERPNE